MKIGIINSGICNLFSLENALLHLNIPFVSSSNVNDLRECSHLILPGVGSFDAGIRNLQKLGLDIYIKEEVLEGKLLLGICLGMQLLFSGSEEGKLSGLSVIEGNVIKFPQIIRKVPHIGWNDLSYISEDVELLDKYQTKDSFYFIHSFHVECSDKITHCTSVHEGYEFKSIVRYKNVFATQFHPEKSQDSGLRILKKFSQL